MTVQVVDASPVESPRVMVYVPDVANVSEKIAPVLEAPLVSVQK